MGVPLSSLKLVRELLSLVIEVIRSEDKGIFSTEFLIECHSALSKGFFTCFGLICGSASGSSSLLLLLKLDTIVCHAKNPLVHMYYIVHSIL